MTKLKYHFHGKNHLARLLTIRGTLLLVELLLVIIFYFIGIRTQLFGVAVVMAVQLFTNLMTALRLRRDQHVGHAEFFLHIVLDIIALTWIFYLSGGYANPLTWAYLLPLIVAAIILPSFYVWLATTITIICYTMLIFWHIPLEYAYEGHTNAFNLHLHGMWFGFVFSAGIIAYFVTRLSTALREQERQLAQTREKMLEQERVVTLGALAANAAHEFGTPLSTMAILVNEIKIEYEDDAPLQSSLQLLRQQIDRCKNILSAMAKSYGQPRADPDNFMSLRQFLTDTLYRWQDMHPEIPLQLKMNATNVDQNIFPERTLGQAITHLLNNAADASPQGVLVIASWNDCQIDLQICDQGDNFPMHSEFGKPFFTTKQQGHQGLGVYLSRTVIESLGGTLDIKHAELGGTVAYIHLPVSSLQRKDCDSTLSG